MKKTFMVVAVLGLVVGMKISTVSSLENKNEYTKNTAVEKKNKDSGGFKVLNKETNKFEEVENNEYNDFDSNSNRGFGNGFSCH